MPDLFISGENVQSPIKRIGIFSRWDERNLDFARTEPDGWSESGGYEGDFISVRAPLNWAEGKYTFNLSTLDDSQTPNRSNTWVELTVFSHNDGSMRRIGALNFPGRSLKLWRHNICSFIEIFGADKPPLEDYPQLKVIFSNFRANGRPWNMEKAVAIFPKEVPQIARVSGNQNQIIVNLSKKPIARTEYTVEIEK